MPELIEVVIITNQLRELLVDKLLVNIGYDSSSRYAKDGSKGIPGFQFLKFPYKVVDIHNKGKKIIFTLQHNEIKVFILSFLGMSGRWQPTPGNHSNLWLEFGSWNPPPGSGPIIRICDFKMYFEDNRHFGSFTIFPDQKSLDTFVNKTTGPDLLNDNVTSDQWTKKIKNPKLKNKAICLFLLDQKQFSGIGAYLRSEVLYRSKINPNRLLANLTDEEIKTLFEVIMATLQESYESNGLTIRDYLSPDGSTGNFKCLVYGQKKDPLGNPVVKEKDKNGRMNHYVIEVQK